LTDDRLLVTILAPLGFRGIWKVAGRVLGAELHMFYAIAGMADASSNAISEVWF
jgi:hypothetical protein